MLSSSSQPPPSPPRGTKRKAPSPPRRLRRKLPIGTKFETGSGEEVIIINPKFAGAWDSQFHVQQRDFVPAYNLSMMLNNPFLDEWFNQNEWDLETTYMTRLRTASIPPLAEIPLPVQQNAPPVTGAGVFEQDDDASIDLTQGDDLTAYETLDNLDFL